LPWLQVPRKVSPVTMNRHILLIVSSYLTPVDPRRGLKFSQHLSHYRKKGWKVGLVSTAQQDVPLNKCFTSGSFILKTEKDGAPVLQNCITPATLPGRLPWRASLSRRAALYTIDRYVKKFGRPDILHGHGTQSVGIVSRSASLRHGIPYVLTEHISDFMTGKISEYRVEELRPVIACAERILPVSAAMGRSMKSLFGDDMPHWEVVPNIVDDIFFEEDLSEKGSGPFTVFSVGYLSEKKRPDVLLQAFALAFKGKNAQLRLGGDGPALPQTRALAKTLGIEEQFIALGAIPNTEVAKEMARADVYVVSSDIETFGIPVIESFACGTPVISTCCGGPEDMVTDDNGILVPRNDPAAMTAAMTQVRDHAFKYDPLKIREACRAIFSADAVLDKLSTIYTQASLNREKRTYEARR